MRKLCKKRVSAVALHTHTHTHTDSFNRKEVGGVEKWEHLL